MSRPSPRVLHIQSGQEDLSAVRDDFFWKRDGEALWPVDLTTARTAEEVILHLQQGNLANLRAVITTPRLAPGEVELVLPSHVASKRIPPPT